jgi:hypothetical protein
LEDDAVKIGFVFWLLMLLWLLFGLYLYWPQGGMSGPAFGPVGGNLLLFILLFILGWKSFGLPIQNT